MIDVEEHILLISIYKQITNFKSSQRNHVCLRGGIKFGHSTRDVFKGRNEKSKFYLKRWKLKNGDTSFLICVAILDSLGKTKHGIAIYRRIQRKNLGLLFKKKYMYTICLQQMYYRCCEIFMYYYRFNVHIITFLFF